MAFLVGASVAAGYNLGAPLVTAYGCTWYAAEENCSHQPWAFAAVESKQQYVYPGDNQNMTGLHFHT